MMSLDFFLLLKQEIALSVMIFVLFFMRLGKDRTNERFTNTMNLLLFLNFILGLFCNREGVLFNEMFHTGRLIALEKNILNLAMLLISLQSYSWLKTHKHVPEFYILLLSSMLGMFFMISSGNLLMFYLGLEMSTIPVAAAANFDLTRRRSSEGAMKLIFSSALSSACLLFGISMLYGTTGTLVFSELPQQINNDPLQLFAFILIVAGFGFKISAVPFHLWTADVYEGAPVAVTSFLSVVSKGAALFVFVPVLFNVFKPLAGVSYNMLFILSLLTILIGNLFAIRQDNFKRFLAFSSIAQVGFIMVGMAGNSDLSATSVVYFVLIYVFSNLAAFGVVSLVSAVTGKERISDYRSFHKTNPALSWVLAIAMFSLAGVPPTAGFFGKYFLLMAGAQRGNYVLIAIAALNIVISLYYYLRVVKVLFIDANPAPIPAVRVPLMPRLSLIVCVAGAIIAGVAGQIYDYIYSLITHV